MPEPLVKVVNLKKFFPLRSGLISSFLRFVRREEKKYIHAVDGISFAIRKREIFGLAGESGCGKTTTGMTLVGLYKPTEGKIYFKGKDLSLIRGKELKKLRRKLQMIFQDPYASLNPRFTVFDTVAEPLRIHKIGEKEEITDRVSRALEESGLKPPEFFFDKFPHELSGGQRQRVCIARALVLEPEFLVADEPVSMLDVSIRAGILDLLQRLNRKLELACLFISHDLSVMRHICHRVAIMYLGKIVEKGPTEELIKKPLHPYSKALISAVPEPDPDFKRTHVELKGEVGNPVEIPRGCRFRPRCSFAMKICKEKEPPLIKIGKNREVACHLFTD